MPPPPGHRTDLEASAVTLTDGRRVAVAQTGPVDGLPVLYCHGAIGTPVGESVDLGALTHRLGIRHVAISRPGFGGSDLVRGRSVLEVADDIAEVADRLGLGRFCVIGVSAGGPYALAVAHRHPERVQRVAVCSALSPLCPPHRTPGMPWRIGAGLSLLAAAPATCERIGGGLLPILRRWPRILQAIIAAHAAPGERGRLAEPAERGAAAASFINATAGGVAGMIEDYRTYSRPWGFQPGQVRAEVHVWHGAADPLVPVDHALALAAVVPRCRVFVDPDEGHHFFRRRLPDILAALVAPVAARAS